jgi:hypothetical protein
VATIVNPMAFGFDPGPKPFKQDLARAKKLLAEAGQPNGFEVDRGVLIAGDPGSCLRAIAIHEAAGVDELQMFGKHVSACRAERAPLLASTRPRR